MYKDIKPLLVICAECRDRYWWNCSWHDYSENIAMVMSRETFTIDGEICDKCQNLKQ